MNAKLALPFFVVVTISILFGCANSEPTVKNTTITFKNNSFTDITINFGGSSDVISPGLTRVFTGPAKANSTGTATTSGETTGGTLVGEALSWDLDYSFPSSGNKSIDLNVDNDFFFLYLINNSSYSINKVYVNYGLQSQTLDNVVVATGGTKYRIGYYKAWSNSNVRLESGDIYWTFSALSLPSTNNQSTTLTAIN